jgi:hypothetical protein
MKLHYFFSGLLLCCISSVSAAELSELQSFFTTKSERQQLDQLRNNGAFNDRQPQSPSAQPAPDVLQMQGVVIREQGKPVFFVNDENTLHTHHLSNDVEVREHLFKNDNYSVPLRVKGDRLKLRPGEQWRSSDRQVQDSYQINATSPTPDGVAQPQ